MSNLVPSIVGLDKGLNLQTAKLVAPPGSVLDTLNYEQVDFQGQKRIDGFTRYDGSLPAAIDEYYKITLTDTFAGGSLQLLSVNDGLVGISLNSVGTNVIYMAVLNENLVPSVGDTLYILSTSDGSLSTGNVITGIQTGTESAADADEHYNNLLNFNYDLRSVVGELPGGIAGLHWFRDRLYAVAEVTTVSLNGTTIPVYPNDTLTINDVDDITADTAKVLDVLTLANTQVLFLSSLTPALWQVEGTTVYRSGSSVGTVANGFEVLTATQEIASFFESRSEAQAIAETTTPGHVSYGWRFVDQGWSVLFENGLSLFGSLPSLNQNISGLGTQGPTSTAGVNGKPLVLLQKVAVAGEPTQVNGWKSTTTPSTYELNSGDVADDDDNYAYADAFIAWDGTTGLVSAPGLTTATLTEYSATNSVVVDID